MGGTLYKKFVHHVWGLFTSKTWIKGSLKLFNSLKQPICLHSTITYISHVNAMHCCMYSFCNKKRSLFIHIINHVQTYHYMHTKTMSIHTITNLAPYKSLQKTYAWGSYYKNTFTTIFTHVECIFHPSNVEHAFNQIILNINPRFLIINPCINSTQK
jgi:hypothetical protein